MNSQPPMIAKFTFVRALGSGGAANVFLYRQGMPERDVAIKVLNSEVVNSDLVAAFEAEANLMARVSNHPAIASIFEANITADGRPYIVMEYCPPPSLGQRFRKERLSIAEALRIGIQICGAVETAHRAGIIHRDIKPANILFTEYQRPVLSDFGIATAFAGAPTQGNHGLSLLWAPPEIISNTTNDNDTRTDIYSLAATIYALVAARSPFETPHERPSEADLVARILHQNAPPTGRPDSPDALEHVFARALAKDPAARYSSAVELGNALQLIQTQLHLERTPIDIVNTGTGAGPKATPQSMDHTMTSAISTSGPLADHQAAFSSMGPPTGPPPATVPQKRRNRGVIIGASVASLALVVAIGVGAAKLLGDEPSGPNPPPTAAASTTAAKLIPLDPLDFDPEKRGTTPTPGFYGEAKLSKALKDIKEESGLESLEYFYIKEDSITVRLIRDDDSGNVMSCTVRSETTCNRELVIPRDPSRDIFTIADFDPKLVSSLASNSRELLGLEKGVISHISTGNIDYDADEIGIWIKVQQNDPTKKGDISTSLDGVNIKIINPYPI